MHGSAVCSRDQFMQTDNAFCSIFIQLDGTLDEGIRDIRYVGTNFLLILIDRPRQLTGIPGKSFVTDPEVQDLPARIPPWHPASLFQQTSYIDCLPIFFVSC